MELEYIRKEVDSVEFFVCLLTKRTGISISGLGRLCGVSKQAISDLRKALSSRAASEWLEPLVGIDLTLARGYSSPDPKTRNVTILKSLACALIITHYAFTGRKTAQLSLVKFNAIGIDTWIKQVVGYNDKNEPTFPKQLKAAVDCRQIYENLEHFNPRVAQLLVDNYVNEIITNALPPNPERLLGVMEISAELGYRIPNNYRSSLGRYVAHRCQDLAKEEQRLVNGQLRFCKLYPLNNSFVRGAITEYARAKELID